MMAKMIILHGEHELASRQKLIELTAAAKQAGRQIKWLDGKKLSLADLEIATGSDSLFGTPITLVVEQVFAGPKSKRKDELVNWLKNQAQTAKTTSTAASENSTDIILWETKTLTVTQLKPFATANAQQFKLANAVFSWLDSVSPQPATKAKQLQMVATAVTAESADFCVIMLQRQVRLLIQAKENQLPTMAPFMAQKLIGQARNFTLDQLLQLHERLFLIDKRQKTGTGPANIRQELEILITKL